MKTKTRKKTEVQLTPRYAGLTNDPCGFDVVDINDKKVMPIVYPDGKPKSKRPQNPNLEASYRFIINDITPDRTKAAERVKLSGVQNLKEALYDSIQEYRKTHWSVNPQPSPPESFTEEIVKTLPDIETEKEKKDNDQALVRRLVVQEIRDADSWEDVVMATQALLKVRSFMENQKPPQDFDNDASNIFKDNP